MLYCLWQGAALGRVVLQAVMIHTPGDNSPQQEVWRVGTRIPLRSMGVVEARSVSMEAILYRDDLLVIVTTLAAAVAVAPDTFRVGCINDIRGAFRAIRFWVVELVSVQHAVQILVLVEADRHGNGAAEEEDIVVDRGALEQAVVVVGRTTSMA